MTFFELSNQRGSMPKPISEEKRLEWKERILSQQKSGSTISRWCRENQISYNSYQYWKKRFRSRKPLRRDFFTELSDAKSGITLQYKNIKIYLEKDFDTLSLEKCIHALRSSTC
jgi:hypothetical protein